MAADESNEALGAAIRAGTVAAVAKLLPVGSDPNGSVHGAPLISIAATAGRDTVVKLLLARGADPNTTCSMQPALVSALIARANIGTAEVQRRSRTAELFLDAGVSVDVADERTGRTAFWFACNLGRGKASSLVKRMFDSKPNLLAKDYEDFSILHMAAGWNHLEVLAAAIAAGADVNAVFLGGLESALSLAASRGHHDVIDMLLAAGANPNVGSEPLKRPLTCAAIERDLGAIDKLRAAGADTVPVIEYLRMNGPSSKIIAELERPSPPTRTEKKAKKKSR